ncbi:MAG: hypothetical protein R2845_05875 [Thermomicrobiales bacterium]
MTVIGTGERGFTDGAHAANWRSTPHGMALSARSHTTTRRLRRPQPRHSRGIAQTGGVRGRRHRPTRVGSRARARARRQLASPWDLVWRDDGIWIAMAGWHQIWKLDLDAGVIAPVAGTGAESIHDGTLDGLARPSAQPSGITWSGDAFYIADSETSAVRRIDPVADRVSRIVGRGLFHFGDIDARGDSVRLQHPLESRTVAAAIALYLADSYNKQDQGARSGERAGCALFGNSDAPDSTMVWPWMPRSRSRAA